MRVALPLIFLVLGFAAGWLLRPDGSNSPTSAGANLPKSDARGDGRKSGSPANSQPSQVDITQRLDLAFAEGQPNFAAVRSLMAALEILEVSNIDEFKAFFRTLPLKGEQIVLWRFFFSAWGEVDPAAALAFIDERFETSGNRRLFYLAVLDTWRDESPDDALEFAMENLTAPGMREQSALAFDYLREMAKEHPEEAIELAAQLGSEEIIFDLTGRRVAQLGKGNPQAALDALESLEGAIRAHAVAQYVIDWAKDEAPAAAKWLAEQYDPAMGLYPLLEVAKQFVSTAPDAALKWIESLPSDLPHGRILGEAVLAWARQSPTDAAGWLRTLESNPRSDPAVVSVGQQVAQSDPQSAIEEWVPRVTDPAQREELLAGIARGWQADNAGEFSNWIERTTALTPEAKQRLLVREFPTKNAVADPGGTAGDPALDSGR